MNVNDAINKVEPIHQLARELKEIAWKLTMAAPRTETDSTTAGLKLLITIGQISEASILLTQAASAAMEVLKQIEIPEQI